jgi:hypothetical protein
VGNRRFLYVDLHKVLPGVFDALADGVRYLGGLAQAKPDGPFLIAHHNQGRKLKYAPALNGLGDAVQGYDFFFVFAVDFLPLTAVVAVTSAGSSAAARAAAASALESSTHAVPPSS